MSTTTEPTTETPIDPERVDAFAGEIFGHVRSGLLVYMIDLGHRTGLWDAAAAGGTCEQIAERAGVQERYAREWLGAVTTGGIVRYDAATTTYLLPPEHAACLTGTGAENLAPFATIQAHLGKHLHDVADAFIHGGGVPYESFRPEFTDVMDGISRFTFDGSLVDGLLPLAPGLVDRLRAGVRVADVGCGTGHALVLLAQAFPASTFVGYDLADEALDRGRKEAADLGLDNVRYEQRDVAHLDVEDAYDVIVSFDTIHDQVDPVAVLAAVHRALVPGGTYVMVEPVVSSNLEDNIENPMSTILYGVSTLHCLTVSLAHGGAGLGTAFGEQKAHELLRGAGFADTTQHPHPVDPIDGVFVSTKVGA